MYKEITDKTLFQVRIPRIYVLDDYELEHGYYATIDLYGNISDTSKEIITSYLSVPQILEAIEKGASVRMPIQSDVKKVYEILISFLKLYEQTTKRSLNKLKYTYKHLETIQNISKMLFDEQQHLLVEKSINTLNAFGGRVQVNDSRSATYAKKKNPKHKVNSGYSF